MLVTPTAGTVYRIAEVEWDPIRLNTNLGFYTNFGELYWIWRPVAAPASFRDDDLPFGITLVGQACAGDEPLSAASLDRFQRASVEHAGALEQRRSLPVRPIRCRLPVPGIRLARRARCRRLARAADSSTSPSVGRIWRELPLNHQLSSRGATFVRRSRTVPAYRFYALPGGLPLRPGLVRVPSGGASVDVEVWSVPEEHFPAALDPRAFPLPSALCEVDLDDGQQVSGFVCEAHAVEGSRGITALGGWKQYLSAR